MPPPLPLPPPLLAWLPLPPPPFPLLSGRGGACPGMADGHSGREAKPATTELGAPVAFRKDSDPGGRHMGTMVEAPPVRGGHGAVPLRRALLFRAAARAGGTQGGTGGPEPSSFGLPLPPPP